MPRAIRLNQTGVLHHVIAKGNANLEIFRDTEDYRKYLSLLKEAVSKYSLEVYNYCLVSSYVNLLVKTKEEGSLSLVMKYVTREYARYFNQKYNSSGHVFQGRFKSFAVQDDQFYLPCSRFIDLNPVKDSIVADVKDHKWTGYNQLAFGSTGEFSLDFHELYQSLGQTAQDRQLVYRSLVGQNIGPELDLMNRKTGILGTKEFKDKLKQGTSE